MAVYARIYKVVDNCTHVINERRLYQIASMTDWDVDEFDTIADLQIGESAKFGNSIEVERIG